MARHRTPAAALFTQSARRPQRVLILPKFLYSPDPQQNVAETLFRSAGPEFNEAHKIIRKWADMESNGLLAKKETALDANFLADVFGNALRYTSVQHADPNSTFTLDRQLAVPGIGSVDGALGFFPLKDPASPDPIAVIELKGADTDLDTDKSNGRTAVQQLFDYLNGLPDTKWGIVSNFSTIRLYHKSRGDQTYEAFSLQKLAHDLDHFKAFWCLLEKGGLLPSAFAKTPRADALLTKTGERQKEVGDELYDYYSTYRSELMATLRDDFQKPLDEAIRIAQKIFDRIIFVAFCEDSGFFPPDCIQHCINQIGMFDDSPNPRWRNIQNLFHAVYNGHYELRHEDGFEVPLFASDPEIERLQLSDDWALRFEQRPAHDLCRDISIEELQVLSHAATSALCQIAVL